MISEIPYLIYFEASFPDHFKDCVIPDKVASTKGKEERLAWIMIDQKAKIKKEYVSIKVQNRKKAN